MKRSVSFLIILLLISMVSMIGVNLVGASTTTLSVDTNPPTRFYFPSTGAAAVSPAFSGDWERNADADRLRCVTARIVSAMTNKTSSEAVTTSPYDVLTRQYVSDQLQAQTISGTVKGQIRTMESAAAADFMRAIVIKVVSGDGGTVRGTLLSHFPVALTASEYPTIMANRYFPSSLALSSVAAQKGDRIVIEVGTRAFNTLSTSYTATHNFGDNSDADLPEDESTVAAYNPWIEFSQNIAFAPPTRFYLPSMGAAAVSPAFSGDWERNADADRLKCVTLKTASTMISKTSSEAVTTSPYDVLTRQYVSDPIKAQTISGTVKGQIRTKESAAAADFMRAIVIKVVSGDGGTVRGTLLSHFPSPLSSEYNSMSLYNRYFPPSTALGSVDAQEGDRIVIEVGTRAFNILSTSYTATHNFGDNSDTDLPEDESTVAAYNPWIEFSQNIDFVTPTPTFTVNVNVADATNLFGSEFKLWYKTSILTAISATHPSSGFFQPVINIWQNLVNDTAGFVWFSVSQGSVGDPPVKEPGVSGSGILAKITFKVDALGATCLYLVDSMLTDYDGLLVAHDVSDGHFSNSQVHNVAITSVNATTTVILGQTINVSVTARNHGTYTESFTVGAYASPYPVRFYLPSTGVAAASPTFSGTWENTTDVDRLRCVTTMIDSPMTSKTSWDTAGTSSYDVLTRQYVSDPLQAQTISGTVKGQISTKESAAAADFSRAIVIKVVSGDGNTLRGTLLTHFPASLTSEYSDTNLTNRYFPPPYTALTSVDAQEGDRIVIEIGTRAFNTLSTGYKATHRFGDNNTIDLPENELTTFAYNPWIEFSKPILFASTTAIAPSQDVTSLAAGGRKDLIFTWNTAGVTLGKYLIKANATTVSGETDTSDNTLNKWYDYDKAKDFVDVTITIIDYPEAIFNYSTLQNAFKAAGFNASDSDPHGGANDWYYWDFGVPSGTGVSRVSPYYSYVYNCSGTYKVTLRLVDTEGLEDITWHLVTVTFASDIVKPHNGLVDCYDLTAMGKAYGWTGTAGGNIADTTRSTESPGGSGSYPPDGKVDNVDLKRMGNEFGSSLPS